MNIELYEINVKLSKYQKKKFAKLFVIMKNENLVGIDTLLIPSKSFKNQC